MCYGSLRKFLWKRFSRFLNMLPLFGGPTGSKSFFDVVSILGPQKTGTTMLFFFFSNTGCRGTIQGRFPQIFLVNLDQLVLEVSCSRQRRSQTPFSYLSQAVCGFTAARQGSRTKYECSFTISIFFVVHDKCLLPHFDSL